MTPLENLTAAEAELMREQTATTWAAIHFIRRARAQLVMPLAEHLVLVAKTEDLDNY